jgi:hypothetical protein
MPQSPRAQLRPVRSSQSRIGLASPEEVRAGRFFVTGSLFVKAERSAVWSRPCPQLAHPLITAFRKVITWLRGSLALAVVIRESPVTAVGARRLPHVDTTSCARQSARTRQPNAPGVVAGWCIRALSDWWPGRGAIAIPGTTRSANQPRRGPAPPVQAQDSCLLPSPRRGASRRAAPTPRFRSGRRR